MSDQKPPAVPGPQQRSMAEELELRFSYHPPIGDQAQRYAQIRAMALNFARFIAAKTPVSREQSLAITAIEEAVFYSCAAIARREGPGG